MNAHNYLLRRLDGNSVRVRILGDLIPIGETRSIKVGEAMIEVEHESPLTLVERMPRPISETIVLVAGSIAVLGFCSWLLWLTVSMNTGVDPDANVMAAASQVGPNIKVSKSEYAQWSGCDRADSRVYKVYSDGVQKAIVCQGPVIDPFGVEKAPTLRYKTGK